MKLAIAIATAILVATPGAHGKPAEPTPTAKRTCDPTKVHTGPRGGRYTLTRDCRRVYTKKR